MLGPHLDQIHMNLPHQYGAIYRYSTEELSQKKVSRCVYSRYTLYSS